MDFSAANTGLWSVIIQFGIIAGILLIANLLRRKLAFIRKSLMPTAVIGGFLLLLLRSLGFTPITRETLEMITYHGIALGFIALSLRVLHQDKDTVADRLAAPKSGALIVSTYLVQGILGLIISMALAYTLMPGLFEASGILLPMGYGQGPGQANNIGSTYEGLGFIGGRSFGLSLAAAGYLSACIVGVIYLNYLHRKGRVRIEDPELISGSVTVDTFQDQNEVPLSESIDRLSVQVALVLLVYLFSYLVMWGITSMVSSIAPGAGGTVNSLIWGFNFIFASLIAMLVKLLMKRLIKMRVMNRQYQNNYLLSRISGLAFDLMIIAGIASIEISDIEGLLLPFLLMAVTGAIATLIYLQWICKKVYPDYYYEGMLSMYGMLTGTISSGILLLREIDPLYKTLAASNLVTGSSVAVLFGAPMLVLIGIAPNSTAATIAVAGIMAVYLAALLLFMNKIGKGTGAAKKKAQDKQDAYTAPHAG